MWWVSGNPGKPIRKTIDQNTYPTLSGRRSTVLARVGSTYHFASTILIDRLFTRIQPSLNGENRTPRHSITNCNYNDYKGDAAPAYLEILFWETPLTTPLPGVGDAVADPKDLSS